jgi:hypothetical protein
VRVHPLLNGQLGDPYLGELLLQLHADGISGDVLLARSDARGNILLQHGEIVHAQACGPDPDRQGLRGAAALYAMMAWPSGRYQLMTAAGWPERTISSSFEDLLLEASRRIGVWEEVRMRLPAADTVLGIDAASIGVIRSRFSSVELTVLEQAAKRLTLQEILDESKLGAALCGQAILRLLSIGLLRVELSVTIQRLFDSDLRTIFPVHEPLWREMLIMLNPMLERPNTSDPLIAKVDGLIDGKTSLYEIARKLEVSEAQVLSAIDHLVAARRIHLRAMRPH